MTGWACGAEGRLRGLPWRGASGGAATHPPHQGPPARWRGPQVLPVINTPACAPPVFPLARRPGAEGTAWGEADSGWRAAFCQCKQIISVCLGGGGWGRELSWALLCSEKKRQKIWVTNHKLFCFRHNWHKQAFSLWFLAGRSLGWLGWEGRGLRLCPPGQGRLGR